MSVDNVMGNTEVCINGLVFNVRWTYVPRIEATLIDPAEGDYFELNQIDIWNRETRKYEDGWKFIDSEDEFLEAIEDQLRDDL